MKLQEVVLFVSAFLNLGIGLAVWLHGQRNQVRIIFSIFSIAVSLWAFGLGMFFISQSLLPEIFWARTLYFAGSLIAFSLCYFSLIFPSAFLSNKKIAAIGAVLLALSLAVFTLTLDTSLVVTTVTSSTPKQIQFGSGYWLWLVQFLLLISFAFNNLFIQFRRTTKFEKLQIKYILIGTFSAAIFGSTTNVILPTIGNFRFFSLGPLLTIFMACCIAYSIIRHRLMDIRLVVARAIAYTVLITIIGVFYVGATFSISNWLFGTTSSRNQTILYALLTIAVAFSFDRTKKLVEKITDGIFFKENYNTDEVLSRLGELMSSNMELQPLAREILTVLKNSLKSLNGSFILFNKHRIYQVISTQKSRPDYTSEDVAQFLPNREIIIFDELEEGLLKQKMRELGCSVVVKLEVEKSVIGLLILEEKASGEIYSDQDVELLNILAPEMAVAIQNAQSIEEIKKFNVTLKQEVERATKDLTIANIKLKDLDHLKDDFVSIASHELRTPMTAIRSYAWMALNRSDVELSDKMKRYLSRTLLSTERLINLVNDMLNISRIESGRVAVTPLAFDMRTLVRDVCIEVDPKAKEKALVLRTLDAKIPKVFADPDKVHQVLLNLIGNAMKFTPRGGSVTVSFELDDGMLTTSVKDSGVGIIKDDLSRLFTKFGRLDNSYVAAATSGGTGLGLYVSKSLIDLMKGKIWATSEGTGKGATFSFSLPVASEHVLSHAKDYAVSVIGEPKALETAAI